MTPIQWKKLVEKKVSYTVEKEVLEESSQKTKLHDTTGTHVGFIVIISLFWKQICLKKYFKELTWENSRTVIIIIIIIIRYIRQDAC